MDQILLKDLLKKYREGTVSDEEARILENWYLFEAKQHDTEVNADELYLAGDVIWKRIDEDTGLSKSTATKPLKLWVRIAAIASIVLVPVIGFWFYTSYDTGEGQNTAAVMPVDIAPGKNTATLTLANGKTITLSDAKTAVVIDPAALTYDDGTAVTASSSDIQIEGRKGNGGHSMNQIGTPRGGQYQVILSDGTKVWLNAASSLKFPVKFIGNERSVELNGEAYFEVAKKHIPFVVFSKGQKVEVLGTHFNINGYQDEGNSKTTLLEGSVRITVADGNQNDKINRPKGILLKPNQQAVLTDRQLKVTAVDVEYAMAWKNGDFIFNEDIKAIMRQISRWYNVEVQYQGDISNEEFIGSVPRSKTLREVLKALELTKKVHFNIEGRRVTVMP